MYLISTLIRLSNSLFYLGILDSSKEWYGWEGFEKSTYFPSYGISLIGNILLLVVNFDAIIYRDLS